MNEESPIAATAHSIHDIAAARLSQHRFMAMIIGSSFIACMLTAIGLSLYNSSGTAQLDLSRPGYSAVRSKAAKADKIEGFANTGPINEETLQQFRTLYDEQLKQMTAVDAYSGDALSTASLKID
jgi:hypothetical protein